MAGFHTHALSSSFLGGVISKQYISLSILKGLGESPIAQDLLQPIPGLISCYCFCLHLLGVFVEGSIVFALSTHNSRSTQDTYDTLPPGTRRSSVNEIYDLSNIIYDFISGVQVLVSRLQRG